ncbi:MAG: hypothetical protein JSW01_04980 [Candidatus Bathyarchaeota archaeon]|nr:MAG: hypothetical protein JSW01_04980 [Candidatus Bathyarchaeota archaeon]
MNELWQWFYWQWFWILITTLAIILPTWFVSKSWPVGKEFQCGSCGSTRSFKLVTIEESGVAQVECTDCGVVESTTVGKSVDYLIR